MNRGEWGGREGGREERGSGAESSTWYVVGGVESVEGREGGKEGWRRRRRRKGRRR